MRILDIPGVRLYEDTCIATYKMGFRLHNLRKSLHDYGLEECNVDITIEQHSVFI